MILRYFYHRDLAQASYMVGCAATGEALIMDPNRDIQQYIDAAAKEDLTITKVTETHIHADYVSGARELAAKTGAELLLSDAGPDDWKYAFAGAAGATLIDEGDVIKLGNIRLEVLHTPGHTPEHVSFLVTDTAGADRPMGIFTGDFLFVGDVGRPDLLEKAAGESGTAESGARTLFQSIQRVKELPDFVQVWPGHGAGSPCGKALGAVPQTTIGYERLFNWAFQIDNESEFVRAVQEEQPDPPVYFAQMKRINKIGPEFMSELPDPVERPGEIHTALTDRRLIVDTRTGQDFADGHIPGTISIPFDAGFVMWAGWFLPYDSPYFLIADPERIDEIVHELRMIGLDNLSGYWPLSVLEEWTSAGGELEPMPEITVDELAQQSDAQVIDVRAFNEYQQGHIPESTNLPLGRVPERLDDIPSEGSVFHCQTGRRSAIATSIALANGIKDARNLVGGFSAWQESGKPVEAEETAAV